MRGLHACVIAAILHQENKIILHGSESDPPMASSASSASAVIDDGFELVKKLTVETLENWASFTGRLCRLAFKRRCFGHLGQWLKAIKAGERIAKDDGATGSRARGADRRTARR